MYRIAARQDGQIIVQARENNTFLTAGRRFDALYCDKEILLIMDPDGPNVVHRGGTMYRKKGFDCIAAFLDSKSRDFPAFHIEETDVTITGNTLSWKRPPVYALPWSRRPVGNVLEEMAIDGFRRRIESASRNNLGRPGVKKMLQDVPPWARRGLPDGMWRNLVEEFYPGL